MTSAASAASGDPSPPAAEEPPLIAAVLPLVAAWAVDRTFDYLVPADLADSVQVGTLVRVPFGGRNVRGIVTAVGGEQPERALESILSLPLSDPVAPAPLPSLYDWVASRYVVPRARAYERAVPPRVRVKVREPERLSGPAPPELLLSYDGGAELAAAISGGVAGACSLRPLRGHSRGRLIAELISAAAAASDGAALIAVPEVHYGSRVVRELQGVYPSLERVDTSAGDMERSAAWARMAAGHGLAAGGRSVVFAPCPRLRLVVVDEEHDSVYKEDRSPRYDTRRVALERARLQGAVCVLISETPSVEWGAAAAAGSIRRVAPSRHVQREERPVVELVPPPVQGGLSDELHARVRETLRAERSVALLAPRRGYARTVWCSSCRRSLRCPRCEAGLSFEGQRRRVECRRCGLDSSPPDLCPSCGGTHFLYLGRGAERHAEQLAKAFPRVPVIHMDRPAASREVSPRSWSGHGIYVTTWFGTKPELRPDVSLVGVLDADALTRRPDFRAAEQAHQVLVEMAEWAGPARVGGRVVVQTNDPNHHAIQAMVRGDFDFFLQRELDLRRELLYPPFAELVKVSALGDEAAALMEEVAGVARSHSARVLGPISAPFPSGGRDVANRGDRGLQMLLKCPAAQPVAEELRDILPRVPRSTRLRVDVDPR
ncbi:MAG: primosomal protein N' [Actinomycetota bacterium]|nr:primosomal protein N' [Actinomycetota bacterium]